MNGFATLIETNHGAFTAHFSARGLARLDFPGAARTAASASPADQPARRERPAQLAHWQRLTQDALESALAGKVPDHLPPLDLSSGTAFQQRVWKALQAIPKGQTRTYLQVAVAVGRPQAARAAGQACGANPIPVLIPCHRVVAATGGLGGFSGGLPWKRLLLAQEAKP